MFYWFFYKKKDVVYMMFLGCFHSFCLLGSKWEVTSSKLLWSVDETNWKGTNWTGTNWEGTHAKKFKSWMIQQPPHLFINSLS